MDTYIRCPSLLSDTVIIKRKEDGKLVNLRERLDDIMSSKIAPTPRNWDKDNTTHTFSPIVKWQFITPNVQFTPVNFGTDVTDVFSINQTTLTQTDMTRLYGYQNIPYLLQNGFTATSSTPVCGRVLQHPHTHICGFVPPLSTFNVEPDITNFSFQSVNVIDVISFKKNFFPTVVTSYDANASPLSIELNSTSLHGDDVDTFDTPIFVRIGIEVRQVLQATTSTGITTITLDAPFYNTGIINGTEAYLYITPSDSPTTDDPDSISGLADHSEYICNVTVAADHYPVGGDLHLKMTNSTDEVYLYSQNIIIPEGSFATNVYVLVRTDAFSTPEVTSQFHLQYLPTSTCFNCALRNQQQITYRREPCTLTFLETPQDVVIYSVTKGTPYYLDVDGVTKIYSPIDTISTKYDMLDFTFTSNQYLKSIDDINLELIYIAPGYNVLTVFQNDGFQSTLPDNWTIHVNTPLDFVENTYSHGYIILRESVDFIMDANLILHGESPPPIEIHDMWTVLDYPRYRSDGSVIDHDEYGNRCGGFKWEMNLHLDWANTSEDIPGVNIWYEHVENLRGVLSDGLINEFMEKEPILEYIPIDIKRPSVTVEFIELLYPTSTTETYHQFVITLSEPVSNWDFSDFKLNIGGQILNVTGATTLPSIQGNDNTLVFQVDKSLVGDIYSMSQITIDSTAELTFDPTTTLNILQWPGILDSVYSLEQLGDEESNIFRIGFTAPYDIGPQNLIVEIDAGSFSDEAGNENEYYTNTFIIDTWREYKTLAIAGRTLTLLPPGLSYSNKPFRRILQVHEDEDLVELADNIEDDIFMPSIHFNGDTNVSSTIYPVQIPEQFFSANDMMFMHADGTAPVIEMITNGSFKINDVYYERTPEDPPGLFTSHYVYEITDQDEELPYNENENTRLMSFEVSRQITDGMYSVNAIMIANNAQLTLQPNSGSITIEPKNEGVLFHNSATSTTVEIPFEFVGKESYWQAYDSNDLPVGPIVHFDPTWPEELTTVVHTVDIVNNTTINF